MQNEIFSRTCLLPSKCILFDVDKCFEHDLNKLSDCYIIFLWGREFIIALL